MAGRSCTLRLLGAPSLECNGIVATLFSTPKRAAVLCIIAIRGGICSRTDVTSLLWPDSTEARARRSLGQTLHLLRREFGPSLIETEGAEGLRIGSDVSCDVLELQTALRAGDLEAVWRLRSGGLVEGFHVPDAPDFQMWLDLERSRIDQSVHDALRGACHAAAEADQWNDVILQGRRALEVRPTDEDVLRQVLRAYSMAGSGAAGLSYLRDWQRLLRESFDLDLSDSTLALAAELFPRRQRSLVDPASLLAGHRGTPPAAPTRRLHSVTIGALATLIVGLAGVLAAEWLNSPADAAFNAPPSPLTVALESSTDSSDASARALVHAVNSSLSRVPGLRVTVARPGSSDTASVLVVTLSVDGLGHQPGDRIVRVAGTWNGTGVLAGAIDYELPDSASISDVEDLADRIDAVVRRWLRIAADRTRWEFGTSVAAAYHRLVEARGLCDRAMVLDSAGAHNRSIELYLACSQASHDAYRIDPAWEAAATLAVRARVRLSFGMLVSGDRASAVRQLREARQFAEEAVRDGGSEGELLSEFGGVLYAVWMLDRDSAVADSAESVFARLATSGSSSPLVWSRLASLAIARGDFAEARAAALTARTNDLLHVHQLEILNNIFTSAVSLGYTQEARQWCDELRRAADREWTSVLCNLTLWGWTDEPAPSPAVIDAEFGRLESAPNQNIVGSVLPLLEVHKAAALQRAGQDERARKIVEEVVARGDHVEALLLGSAVLLRLGRNNVASGLIEQHGHSERAQQIISRYVFVTFPSSGRQIK